MIAEVGKIKGGKSGLILEHMRLDPADKKWISGNKDVIIVCGIETELIFDLDPETIRSIDSRFCGFSVACVKGIIKEQMKLKTQKRAVEIVGAFSWR